MLSAIGGSIMPVTITYVKKESTTPPQKTAAAYANQLAVFATKTDLVLGALVAGQRLSVKSAALEWDIYCLSQIISHIRKHRHIPVRTALQKKSGPNGKTIYAEYYLSAVDIAALVAKKATQ